MRIWCYLLFSFFSGFLPAQDFKTLIREMRKDYEDCKTLQVAMEITVYDSAQTQPYYRQTVEVKRDGNNYWYQVEENEMLMNEKYLIMVDNGSRQISFSKRNLEAEAGLRGGLTFNIDSIFAQYDTFRYLGMEYDAQHYLVEEKKGPIKEVHFFIVPASRTLKRMAYRYRAGQYVSIKFNVFDKNVVFSASTFSEDRYVTKVNNRMVPSVFYKQYNISYQ